MREKTSAITVCSMIQFVLPAAMPVPPSGRRLTDAQVLNTALVAIFFF
ncbi:hypothetical protein [Hymenobacter sp. IS2118]|nr:hypothetical protein [Hymenobacter sp. IS2118]